MREIDEMYKKYGVKEDAICKYASGNNVYPSFTAEKQIELIKFMLKTHKREIEFFKRYDGYFVIQDWGMGLISQESTFEASLADILISQFDNYTLAQRQEVKEILER